MIEYPIYTIWADNDVEADFASERLDELLEESGSGRNAVRVAIVPNIRCSFDTVYLADEAFKKLQKEFIVVEGW